MIFASVMPLAWKAEPDARIAEMMETEKAGAVEEVRALVHECQLTEQNMFPASCSKAKSFVAMPPETGATRIGRSKPPNWINGKNGRQFLIEKAKS
ncbi:H-NS histone family protein [Delftia acidovorans]|uniref:H-NS histone family protein n=1 Tax=Delftia acidovorans TaxID=80866 RepID=UPI000BC77C21|nr:H-NS histone family protein [Delftia acidovorans]SOE36335.1 DNA-binding protein H-NS [Delftia acidovorans]